MDYRSTHKAVLVANDKKMYGFDPYFSGNIPKIYAWMKTPMGSHGFLYPKATWPKCGPTAGGLYWPCKPKIRDLDSAPRGSHGFLYPKATWPKCGPTAGGYWFMEKHIMGNGTMDDSKKAMETIDKILQEKNGELNRNKQLELFENNDLDYAEIIKIEREDTDEII